MGSAQAFFRRVAMLVGSVARFSFPARPPDTGRSNDGWGRSGATLARFSLFAVPPFAGVSCARLRFKGRHQINHGRKRADCSRFGA
jgi:hypothetical protein